MSFFEWFTNKVRIKRWLFVILLGISLMSIAISQIIGLNMIKPIEVLLIICEFILGTIIVIFGIISIQKRTLEIFVESNGISAKKLQEKDIHFDSLIFDKTVYENGPNVVIIGAGSGVNTIVKGLSNYTKNITCIATLEDPEGNYKNSPLELPYSNVLSCICALSENEQIMKQTLFHKFTSKQLEGYTFGDIYLIAMEEIFGNLSTSIKKSTEVLNINGQVLPVSLDKITICAELTDGSLVKDKKEIPIMTRQKHEAVKRVFIEPTNARTTPGVLNAIENADLIVVAPGNLYTEIIPTLLVNGVASAIKNSKAQKVYVANIMTDEGQTDGYNLSDHIKALTDHIGTNIFEFCIADLGQIIPEYVRAYNNVGRDIVNVDSTAVKKLGTKVLQKNLSKIEDGKIRHDSEAIALTLMQIVLADIKYQNTPNHVQTAALEAVLKDQKKKQLQKEKKLQKAWKEKFKGQADAKEYSKENLEQLEKEIKSTIKEEKEKGVSKFKEKYTQRLESITMKDKIEIKEEKKMLENFFSKNFFDLKKKQQEEDNDKEYSYDFEKQKQKDLKEFKKIENKVKNNIDYDDKKPNFGVIKQKQDGDDKKYNTLSIHNIVRQMNGQDAINEKKDVTIEDFEKIVEQQKAKEEKEKSKDPFAKSNAIDGIKEHKEQINKNDAQNILGNIKIGILENKEELEKQRKEKSNRFSNLNDLLKDIKEEPKEKKKAKETKEEDMYDISPKNLTKVLTQEYDKEQEEKLKQEQKQQEEQSKPKEEKQTTKIVIEEIVEEKPKPKRKRMTKKEKQELEAKQASLLLQELQKLESTRTQRKQ